MGKVITGSGLQDFIQNGTITNVPDHKSGDKGSAPLETKPVEKVVEVGEQKTPEAEAKAPEPVEGVEDEDKDLSEAIRKKIGKKHRAMKEAQEAAADAETFAKSQYERARLAEERASELERKLKTEKPDPDKPALKEPDIAQFTKDGQVDWVAFNKASMQYAMDAAKEEFRAEQAQERDAAVRAEKESKLIASAQEARKAHADFDEVMKSLEGTQADMVPQFVLTYIEESGNPGEVSYYLAKHPEDRERIAHLSPIRGIAELGKLEDRLTKAPEAKEPVAEVKVPERGGAPPPITPISTTGSGSVNTDPARMSYKELREYERSRRKPR